MVKKKGAIQFDYIVYVVVGFFVLVVVASFYFGAFDFVGILPDYSYEDRDRKINLSEENGVNGVRCSPDDFIGEVREDNNILYVDGKDSNLWWDFDEDGDVIRVSQFFAGFDWPNPDDKVGSVDRRGRIDFSDFVVFDSEGKLNPSDAETLEIILSSGLNPEDFSKLHNASLYENIRLCNKDPVGVADVCGERDAFAYVGPGNEIYFGSSLEETNLELSGKELKVDRFWPEMDWSIATIGENNEFFLEEELLTAREEFNYQADFAYKNVRNSLEGVELRDLAMFHGAEQVGSVICSPSEVISVYEGEPRIELNVGLEESDEEGGEPTLIVPLEDGPFNYTITTEAELYLVNEGNGYLSAYLNYTDETGGNRFVELIRFYGDSDSVWFRKETEHDSSAWKDYFEFEWDEITTIEEDEGRGQFVKTDYLVDYQELLEEYREKSRSENV